ncbi:ATP-dependent DNA helicase [Thermospira aquatica]|uniref:AAA family ATPase n=1 Tax=Thermospira aquatica TaxID=2828656 RepID=A0AAX3BCL2_9SPIR|nr:AAA family ATPase [Thermospira aquatica]URA09881.1 AAA family ATPase [Thermospira aquatica]
MNIEINEGFQQVYDALEKGENVFLTGRAGTGKSTFLRYFLEQTQKHCVVLAPTGVAALNVEGQTIHSFYGIFPAHTLEDIPEILKRKGDRLYEVLSHLDMIIIDEISMVRADLLDMVDTLTRRVFADFGGKKTKYRQTLPFGGIQLFFIGDLYQLPPVVTSREKEIFSSLYESPYFFSARCYSQLNMKLYELEKVYRQKDTLFIGILNRIRNGTVTDEDIALLNKRVNPGFTPQEKQYVYLTTHNDIVDEINQSELEKLPGKKHVYEGLIEGDFPQKDIPTDEVLTLKKGAQVMFLVNHPWGLWVNGSIGRVIFCREEVVTVELEDGTEVDVEPYTWVNYHYEIEGKTVKKKAMGKFTQLPLRLAWGITIHKSQGKTFSHVFLDMGRGAFATGQTYVALSRVTSLEGLVLKHPIKKSHVKIDWHIIRFMTGTKYAQAHTLQSLETKREILLQAIRTQSTLEIVYLKSDDTKSVRKILPRWMGEMEYHNKSFEGLRALCFQTNEERTFRVDRILEVHILSEEKK